jgi:hypothetical protein
MAEISRLAAQLRPYWLRDTGAGGATIINQYITEETGGGAVDLSWLVPKSFPIIASAPITISGDFWAAGMTFGLSIDSSGGLEESGGNLRAKKPTNSGIARDANGLYLSPSNLDWQTTNANSGIGHTHFIASSSNPGANASILQSSALGYLTLVRHIATDRVQTPLITTGSGDLAITPATGITSLADLRASTRLRSPLIDSASGVISIAPNTHLELNPGSNLVNLKANKVLQSENYASQTTGMRVTYAGEGDFRYLFADEMHVKVFIADLEQALAGGQIISKSVAVVSRAFTAPAAGAAATLYVWDLPSAENMAVFQSGDIVRLRQFSRASGSLTVADCWGVVTSYSNLADKEQSWTFTRSSGGNAGAMTAGTVIGADSLVLDYGTTGNGFWEVNAIDGIYALNSPYAQVVTWTTHPHTGKTINARLGNLRGIFAVDDEYGLYVGDGVADADAYLRLSNLNAKFNNVPINMWNSGILTGAWNADGTLVIGFGANGATLVNERDFSVHSSGYVRMGWALTGYPNVYWSQSLGYLAIRNGTTDMIRFDVSGDSYFAGRMKIGTDGEIVQGSGTLGTIGSWPAPPSLWGTFTGYRVGRSGSVGLWGLYNAGLAQVYATTAGKLNFGGGNGLLDATGVEILGYAWSPGAAWPPGTGTWPATDPTRGYKFKTLDGHLLGGLTGTYGLTAPYNPSSMSIYLQDSSGNDNVAWSFYQSGELSSPGRVQAPGGYINDSIGSVNISSTGWKRIGEFTGSNGRGFARVTVFRQGGDAAPFHMTIEAFSTYNHTVGQGWINVYGGLGAPISGVRITSDATTKYLEINVTSTSANFEWRQDFGAWPTYGFQCNSTMVSGGGTMIVDADLTNSNVNLHVQGVVLAGYPIFSVAKTPSSSADSSGTQGETRWDTNYIYVRTGTSNPYWKRAALSTW